MKLKLGKKRDNDRRDDEGVLYLAEGEVDVWGRDGFIRCVSGQDWHVIEAPSEERREQERKSWRETERRTRIIGAFLQNFPGVLGEVDDE